MSSPACCGPRRGRSGAARVERGHLAQRAAGRSGRSRSGSCCAPPAAFSPGTPWTWISPSPTRSARGGLQADQIAPRRPARPGRAPGAGSASRCGSPSSGPCRRAAGAGRAHASRPRRPTAAPSETGCPLRRSEVSAASMAATISSPSAAFERGSLPVRIGRAKSASSRPSGSAGVDARDHDVAAAVGQLVLAEVRAASMKSMPRS